MMGSDSSARVKSIMNTVLDSIIVINARGLIQDVNPACARLLGYSVEEMLGQNISMLMGEAHAHQHDMYINHYLNTGEAHIIGIGREVEARHKNGALIPVELAISECEIDGTMHFVGVLHDISERKLAEKAMNHLIEQLRESNEDLERYAYICSHDLQEPLRMIRGFSQKLKEALIKSGQMDDMLEHYLHYIATNAERGQELVRDVLAYARLDKDDVPLEAVNLENILTMVKESLLEMIEHHHALIETESLPVIYGNRTQLYQLMLNLISNALKFQHPNTRAHIRIRVGYPDGRLQIAIQDNGIGIRPEDGDKIFLIFKRLHHRSDYPGNGIGLALCRKIMDRHGGTIHFTSRENEGATFYLTFPSSACKGATHENNRQAG